MRLADFPTSPLRRMVVDDANFARLVAAAEKKNAVSDAVEWTRRWNPDFNLVGLIGEWTYCELTDNELKFDFGDGGVDYGDVDVKGTSHYITPKLMRLATDPFVANRYALVAVDLPTRRSRYVGYAKRAELTSARLVEYGYGPTHTLNEEHLHTELPA